MATAKKNTELAPVENFALTTAYDGLDPELAAELKDQMDDLDDESGINCRTIKIPSGGNLAFTVQGDEDGDEDYLKDIEGVIVFTHRMNGYWPNSFGSSTNPEDKIPVCSSMDGKSGLNIRTGEICECDKCPCNQYGSDPNGGKGKACKNMRRIYLMRSNDPNLYLLTVPPTSIKEVNKALTRIMASKGIPYTNLIVGFKLAKAPTPTASITPPWWSTSVASCPRQLLRPPRPCGRRSRQSTRRLPSRWMTTAPRPPATP